MEEKMEIDKKECKVCKELKIRVRVGRYPNFKDIKFSDEIGLLWNGKTCPTCHKKIMQEKMSIKRAKKA